MINFYGTTTNINTKKIALYFSKLCYLIKCELRELHNHV